MACTNPRHADCPNCGGEVYLEPDGSVRTTRITNRHIDRATGEVLGEDEVTLLPHHVLAPLACPTPLVTFAERIELAKAGKLPDMAKELMGWPQRVVQEALGERFVVDAGRKDGRLGSILPAD